MPDNSLERERAKLEEIKRRGAERLAALQEAARRQAEQVEKRGAEQQRQFDHTSAHMPKPVGMVNDIEFTPTGTIKGEVRMIRKWDDGYGNAVFVVNSRANIVSMDQIQPLSAKIQAQQAAFQAVEPTEQERIRSKFGTPKDTGSDIQPYKDYLQNEKLGKRFEELKANPPRPFGNK